MTLGHRVAVMRDGRIQQVDTPQALYNRPTNLFVAAFIGSPAMNLVEADVSDGALEFGGFRIPVTLDGAVPPRVDRRHPARGVRGRRRCEPVAADDRDQGRGRRGARPRHARDLQRRGGAGRRRRGPRGGGRRGRPAQDRRRSLHRAPRSAELARGPATGSASPSTRAASTSSIRRPACASSRSTSRRARTGAVAGAMRVRCRRSPRRRGRTAAVRLSRRGTGEASAAPRRRRDRRRARGDAVSVVPRARARGRGRRRDPRRPFVVGAEMTATTARLRPPPAPPARRC